MDWDPCANVLLQAADRLDALTTMQGITPEMVNAAWNKGKDLRMTGLPTDFRQVLEAAMRVHQCGWLPVDTAPEDQHVILATTGGHVGEALMLRDEDTGQQKWTWALGPVHPNHTPLGWQPMPSRLLLRRASDGAFSAQRRPLSRASRDADLSILSRRGRSHQGHSHPVGPSRASRLVARRQCRRHRRLQGRQFRPGGERPMTRSPTVAHERPILFSAAQAITFRRITDQAGGHHG